MEKILYALIIFAIFISSCKNNNNTEDVQMLKQQIADYKEQDSLKQLEITDKVNLINNGKTAIQTLQDSIIFLKQNSKNSKTAKADIQKLMTQIDDLLANNQKLALDLKTQLATLGADPSQTMIVDLLLENIKAKNDEIDRLNEDLIAANINVKHSVQVANTATANAAKADSLKIVAQKQKDKIIDEFKTLQGAASVMLTGKKKFKKEEKQVEKADKITAITIDYTIYENSIAKKGEQDIYFVIKSTSLSKINILHNTEQSFSTPNKTKIAYTQKANIDFEGKELTGTIKWNKDKKTVIEPDIYEVIIYTSEGDKIASGIKFTAN